MTKQLDRLFIHRNHWKTRVERPSPDDPCIIRLSERALRRFVQFYDANVDQRAELSGNLRAFWPKLTGYAGRIALCFHLIRCAESGVLTTMLEPETMESAVAVVQWFKREAARIVETVRGEVCEIDFESQAVLDAIRRNGGEITVRELQHSRRVYRNSGGAGLAEKKLREMVKAGILEVHFEQGSRGPGKDVFRLNQTGSGNRFEENTGENAKPVTVTTDIFSENDFPERSQNTTPPATRNEPPRYQFCPLKRSMKTAKEHYLRVWEEDFERSLGSVHPETAGKIEPKTGFPAVEKSLPAIFPAAQPCKAVQCSEAPKPMVRG